MLCMPCHTNKLLVGLVFKFFAADGAQTTRTGKTGLGRLKIADAHHSLLEEAWQSERRWNLEGTAEAAGGWWLVKLTSESWWEERKVPTVMQVSLSHGTLHIRPRSFPRFFS